MTAEKRMLLAARIALKLNEESREAGLTGGLLLPRRVWELSELIVYILSRSDDLIDDNIGHYAEIVAKGLATDERP